MLEVKMELHPNAAGNIDSDTTVDCWMMNDANNLCNGVSSDGSDCGNEANDVEQ